MIRRIERESKLYCWSCFINKIVINWKRQCIKYFCTPSIIFNYFILKQYLISWISWILIRISFKYIFSSIFLFFIFLVGFTSSDYVIQIRNYKFFSISRRFYSQNLYLNLKVLFILTSYSPIHTILLIHIFSW